MQHRRLGKTGFQVSEIGLGLWQLGGDFGPLADDTATGILAEANSLGVNFWDTADVYGSGLSESRVRSFPAKAGVTIATKVGRSGTLYPDKYSKQAIKDSLVGSARRLGVEVLDLVQLHTIPIDVLRQGDVFGWMDELQAEGLFRFYGASVETIEEGLICLEHAGVSTLQIIFNIFRQDAAKELLPRARDRDVGIIVRLPLASGLLSGKFSAHTHFAAQDHRYYNRDGKAFNVGETFSGLPFETGLALADELKDLVPEGWTMAQMALRWILDYEPISTVIAGVSRPEQLADNVAAADRPPLSREVHERLAGWYIERVRPHVRGQI
ncbi:aldo/keto reductase [Paradevosia shaoguanensis]|uniref:aldo/keto reductase n=1 Tax=Paradevosia shaoguanensis TaxID=1335043 RepID=UPI003C72C16B